MLGANEGGIDNKNRLAGIDALFQKIQDSNDSKIDCKGCAIYPHEFNKLAAILKDKTFSEIDLSHNKLNTDCISALHAIILNNNRLVKINLAFNQLDDTFIEGLLNSKEILKRVSSIDFDLSGNNIHEQSIRSGLPFFSVMTVSSMVTATPIHDLALVDYVDETVGEYLRNKDVEEEKKPTGAPIRFFDVLPKSIQINNPTLTFDDEKDNPRPKQ